MRYPPGWLQYRSKKSDGDDDGDGDGDNDGEYVAQVRALSAGALVGASGYSHGEIASTLSGSALARQCSCWRQLTKQGYREVLVQASLGCGAHSSTPPQEELHEVILPAEDSDENPGSRTSLLVGRMLVGKCGMR